VKELQILSVGTESGSIGHLRLAVVTVTFNSSAVLPEFLESLARQTDKSWVLIAIDNNSSDDSVDQFVSHQDPRIHIVRNLQNVGFARATNQGLRIAIDAGIDWVLVLNNDASFEPDTFATLMERAARQDASVYAPQVVHHAHPRVIWYGGGRFSNVWGFRATLEGEGRSDWAPASQERWVNFVPGCCKLISTRLLQTSGLYDEDYFVYWEDVDLCWRWAEEGTKIRYLPRPVIQHKVSSLTGGETSDFSIRMYHMNQIIFFRKNFSVVSMMMRLVPIAIKIAGRMAVGRDSPGHARRRLSAILEGLRYRLTPGGGGGNAERGDAPVWKAPSVKDGALEYGPPVFPPA